MEVAQNTDRELVKQVKNRLAANDGYCPCSLIKDESTKCICDDFKSQMQRGELGSCHCGLYVLLDDEGVFQ